MAIKNIVFDFNGTILDDVDLCLDILNQMLKRQSKPTFDVDSYKKIFTFPIIQYYLNAGLDFSKDSFEDLCAYFIEIYQPRSYKCNLYPYIKETLKELNDKGYNVILLSASEKNNLMNQVHNFKLTPYFSTILGISNVHAKSKLEIAKRYFEESKLNLEETLFIGDSLHDYEVSSSLGGKCVLVTYGHQDKERLSSAGVPLISDIREIKEYL